MKKFALAAAALMAGAGAAHAQNFEGWSFGFGLGERTSNVDWKTTDTEESGSGLYVDPDTADANFDSDSVRISAFVGRDWHVGGKWVAGFQGEIGYADQDESQVGIPGTYVAGFPWDDDKVTVESSWDAALLGRLGFEATPSLLIYATAGVAMQDVKASIDSDGGFPFADSWLFYPMHESESETLTGWTLGVGVEKAIGPNTSLRLDYRYSDLGDFDAEFRNGLFLDSVDANIEVTSQTLGVAFVRRF